MARVMAIVWPIALVLCALGVDSLSRDALLRRTGRRGERTKMGFNTPPSCLPTRGRTDTAQCVGGLPRRPLPLALSLRGWRRCAGAARMQSQVWAYLNPKP